MADFRSVHGAWKTGELGSEHIRVENRLKNNDYIPHVATCAD